MAISNVDTLNEHWAKTQLGRLMADPVMEPFGKDLRRQFESRFSALHERLGLTLDDMKGVPGGDVGIGLVAPAPGKAALALVVDVTGKLAEAKALLEKTTATQLKRGAKRAEIKEGDTVIIRFDLPEPNDSQEAARSTLKGSDQPATKPTDAGAAPPEPRLAFYCLQGNLLAVTDNREVMQGILKRAAGAKDDCLANHKPYQAVRKRVQSDAPQEVPQIRWFIYPLGYAEAARAATPPDQRRKGRSILEVMRNQGVAVIQGVGGFVNFSAEGYELVHRTAVYAPGPRENAMKMLVLLNEKDYTPEPWVPSNVAAYISFYADILNAFDNFGPLFDELFGAGEPHVWTDTLYNLREDPNGPQIDLREQLVKHMGHRVSIVSHYETPITASSERLLFAIEATNPKALAAGIEKWMANDPNVKRHDVNGQVIWEMVEDNTAPIEPPTIDFGSVPAITPQAPAKPAASEDEEAPARFLPHMAVTVWQGHLMVASHFDFLVKTIQPKKPVAPLRDSADYKRVQAEIQKMTPHERCAATFTRTDEAYRPTYELIRQNKMPESETMFGRLLNALFNPGKKGMARHQKIDGSQLPEYQFVREYLGPAGFQATTEADGWFLKGFTLNKLPSGEKTPAAQAAGKKAAKSAP